MEPTQTGANILLLAVIGVAVILVLVVLVTAVVLYARRRTNTLVSQQRPVLPPDGSTALTQPITPLAPLYGIQSAQDQAATLTVLASDNPAMVGKTILLASSCTTIGSGPGNNITLANDKLVSPQHALLEIANNALFLSEIATPGVDGQVKRPTYGTFVNEQKIGSIPVQLNMGDVIRLGARFRMRFESLTWQLD